MGSMRSRPCFSFGGPPDELDWRGVITVIPVTSNTERVYPFQVLLPAAETGLERDSKAQAEQIRSVAVERVGERLGVVPNAIMLHIDEALRLHLGL
jgi:mRNA interferase MazF